MTTWTTTTARVADPYRWLEDLDSAETAAWVEAENKVRSAIWKRFLQREASSERLTQLWNYERYGVPFKEGGTVFYTQQQRPAEPERAVRGRWPRTRQATRAARSEHASADGTVALTDVAVSDDGKLLAYGLAEAGSDWRSGRLRDVDTGKDLADSFKWVKFSRRSWTQDGKGSSTAATTSRRAATILSDANYFQKLYYHRLGTPQSAGQAHLRAAGPEGMGVRRQVTDDGRYLIITVSAGHRRRNRVYFQELDQEGRIGRPEVVQLLDDFDAEYDFIGNDGPVFWFFRPTLDAPRGRIIAIDIAQAGRERLEDDRSREPSDTLRGRQPGRRPVRRRLSEGRAQRGAGLRPRRQARCASVELPGTRHGRRLRRQAHATRRRSTPSRASPLPPTIYRYDLATGESKVVPRSRRCDFNPDDYETKQVFYTSKDGTQVPMFITLQEGTQARRQRTRRCSTATAGSTSR